MIVMCVVLLCGVAWVEWTRELKLFKDGEAKELTNSMDIKNF